MKKIITIDTNDSSWKLQEEFVKKLEELGVLVVGGFSNKRGIIVIEFIEE